MKKRVIENNPPPAPEIIYAIENLKITVRTKAYNGEVTPEIYQQMVKYINEVTKKIHDL